MQEFKIQKPDAVFFFPAAPLPGFDAAFSDHGISRVAGAAVAGVFSKKLHGVYPLFF